MLMRVSVGIHQDDIEAAIEVSVCVEILLSLVMRKICFWGLRPDKMQTVLLSYRGQLVSKFGFSKLQALYYLGKE